MRMSKFPVLIVPGHGDSGPTHWQSRWQDSKLDVWDRLRVDDWERAVCDDWVAAIHRQVAALGPDTVIAAHSLGCLAVVHWAARHRARIRGALLVAVPDPASPVYPAALSIGFSPVPMSTLAFSTTVVASTDDPYAEISFARSCAGAWGSDFVDVGPRGHINAASALGEWSEGYRQLEALRSPIPDGQPWS